MNTRKTIFITGTSSGLGRASTKLFSAKGWRVIATMRARDAEKETELRKLPGITVLPLDATYPAQITDAVAKALSMGPVDVVYNNAGYGMAGPLEGLTDEQIVRNGQHQSDGGDSHHQGVRPSLQIEEGRAFHQHDVDRRVDRRSVQLDVPRKKWPD